MAEKSVKDEPKAKVIEKAQQPKLTKSQAAKLKVEADGLKVVGIGVSELRGFTDFIRTQGVIGLAIGLAIGAAAGDTVKKLVEGFINPFVQFIVGSQQDLANAVWHFELFGRSADFKWGAFVSSFITLVATALVIYLIVHFFKLDRLDKKKV